MPYKWLWEIVGKLFSPTINSEQTVIQNQENQISEVWSISFQFFIWWMEWKSKKNDRIPANSSPSFVMVVQNMVKFCCDCNSVTVKLPRIGIPEANIIRNRQIYRQPRALWSNGEGIWVQEHVLFICHMQEWMSAGTPLLRLVPGAQN